MGLLGIYDYKAHTPHSLYFQWLSNDDCCAICIKLKVHAHVVFAVLETIVIELEFGSEHVGKRSILSVTVGCEGSLRVRKPVEPPKPNRPPKSLKPNRNKNDNY